MSLRFTYYVRENVGYKPYEDPLRVIICGHLSGWALPFELFCLRSEHEAFHATEFLNAEFSRFEDGERPVGRLSIQDFPIMEPLENDSRLDTIRVVIDYGEHYGCPVPGLAFGYCDLEERARAHLRAREIAACLNHFLSIKFGYAWLEGKELPDNQTMPGQIVGTWGVDSQPCAPRDPLRNYVDLHPEPPIPTLWDLLVTFTQSVLHALGF